MKVDIFTSSRELEDLIISSYSGTLFEDQIDKKIDTSDPDSPCLFCFYDLEFEALRKLLYYLGYEYEIIKSSSGEILCVSDTEGYNAPYLFGKN